MKKLLIASVSGIALMGLAACSDTDTTTTQGVPAEEPMAPATAPDQGMAPADQTAPQPAPIDPVD